MSERMIRTKKGVFPYVDKAPFEPSGFSISGALEINPELDTVKCHECGGWFGNVGLHARAAHRLTPREYRAKHALRYGTSLCSQTIRDMSATAMRNLHRLGKNGAGLRFKKGPQPHHARYSKELDNLRNRCPPQLHQRVAVLIEELGRFPTNRELLARKINPALLIARAGSVNAYCFACCGDKPMAPRRRYAFHGVNAHLLAVVTFTVSHGRAPIAPDYGTEALPISKSTAVAREGSSRGLLLKAAQLAPAPARQILEARAAQLPGACQ